jgi:hypothetical protein
VETAVWRTSGGGFQSRAEEVRPDDPNSWDGVIVLVLGDPRDLLHERGGRNERAPQAVYPIAARTATSTAAPTANGPPKT